jgi:DNA-binding transcriptional MerR regulator
VLVALDSPAGVLMTTNEAARSCGVEPVTIRQWVVRGHLTPIGRQRGGRQLVFRQADVAEANRKTKDKAGRSQRRVILAELAQRS